MDAKYSPYGPRGGGPSGFAVGLLVEGKALEALSSTVDSLLNVYKADEARLQFTQKTLDDDVVKLNNTEATLKTLQETDVKLEARQVTLASELTRISPLVASLSKTRAVVSAALAEAQNLTTIMSMANVKVHIHGVLEALGTGDDRAIKGTLLALDVKDLEALDEQIVSVKKVIAGGPLPAGDD